MLQGDLATLPLPDLFQWVDNARRSGVVEIEPADGLPFWVEVRDRRLVAAMRLAQAAPLTGLSSWTQPLPPETLWPEAAYDRLLDLFLDPGAGRFSYAEGAAGFEDGVALDVPVSQVALEGMRRLDEWPGLDRGYPSEGALLRADGDGPARSPGLNAVLEAARRRLSLGEARLALSLSRPAILRRVEALRQEDLAHVEGATTQADPIARLVDQAQALVRERQFDEAAHVFKSLLAADPSDRRVRNLLREAEREQLAALYEELSPMAVPVLLAGPASLDSPAARRLSPTDREVADRINGRWDVASVALACPLREVETLKALRKLLRLGLADLAGR